MKKLTQEEIQIIKDSGLFDPEWYSKQYPDVALSGLDSFEHFLQIGIHMGRAPGARYRSPRFCAEAYLAIHSDVQQAGSNPFEHFFNYGFHEGRICNWLDRYIEIAYGREDRCKIGSLLDLLLQVQGSDTKAFFREGKLTSLTTRLQAALDINPPAPIATPAVSVIIPVYNQVFYTLACLISLFESAPKTDFEVIIADDCSTDETSTIFSKFSDRIRVVRTPGNLGFLKNCNHAAKEAKGEFVVFLNNDMVLLPDWLDSLVATISQDTECGMVGSKLLNLDGTLQEAGGIFWNDGSAWNYGRGQNPMAPEFNYKKEVDYCSGASICLHKEVWDAVGGFDEIYAPAYCEESDLAFRLRARGLKTIYQPRSVGIHLEGVSCGTDTSKGIKAYQVENQKKLLARWSGVLKKEHFENGTNVFHARGRTKSKKSILIVDHYIPQYDRDAGSRTIGQIIDILLEKDVNVLFWPHNGARDPIYTSIFQEKGVYVLYSCEEPLEFNKFIKDNAMYIDAFFISRPNVADEILPFIKKYTNKPVYYYGHDIHFRRLENELQFQPGNKNLEIERDFYLTHEKQIWASMDVIFYPSIQEVEFVKTTVAEKCYQADVRLLPVFVFDSFNDAATSNLEDRQGVLFVAGFAHRPNQQGALWFMEKVWPALCKKHPDLSLTLAGSNPPAELLRLQSDRIKITGYIPDEELDALYLRSRVAVAPLLSGAGMKGKVAESLKWGLPVVTTSVGAQGFQDYESAITVSDSPSKMAEEISALLLDDARWRSQSSKAVCLAKKHFSKSALWSVLGDILTLKK